MRNCIKFNTLIKNLYERYNSYYIGHIVIEEGDTYTEYYNDYLRLDNKYVPTRIKIGQYIVFTYSKIRYSCFNPITFEKIETRYKVIRKDKEFCICVFSPRLDMR